MNIRREDIYAFYDETTNVIMCIGDNSIDSLVLEEVEMRVWDSDLCNALERALTNSDLERIKVGEVTFKNDEATDIEMK